MSDNSTIQRNLWEYPWGYVESFLIGFGLVLTGFMLELATTSTGNVALSFPFNVYALATYIALLFVLYKWFINSALVRWLSKVPASISSIALLTLLVMIMGIVPQVPSDNSIITNLGLNRITSNWAFLLILFQFLTCLGLVTIKRILQFKKSNLGFILNHLGLFLALTAGVLGSGDVHRLSLNTYEGKNNWIATDKNNREIALPFAIHLNDFLIEEYNPKVALIDNESGEILYNDGENLYLIEKGKNFIYKNFEVIIDEYHSTSGRIGDNYAPVNEIGAPPSALISVRNTIDNSEVKGWISCGSFSFPYQSLKINEEVSMVMTIPEAKKFSSDITILSAKGDETPAVLEVNKPFKYGGWKLYQLSYDEKLGKWSNLSVIELVRDPWLPIIYAGIFMMIFGAVYMFWVGNRITKNQ